MTEMRSDSDRGQPAAKRALRRGMIWFAAFIVLMALSMFLAAGDFGWLPGWIFLGVYLVMSAAVVAYLWRVNPEVVVARSNFRREGEGVAQRVIFVLLFVLFIAMFPVAALDAGRFHWSAVPPWLVGAGYLLTVLGMVGNTWVLSVNKFAEPSVRVQTERGQQVIDRGPYAVVRHPLYATAFLLCAGIPLALASYWALAPAGVAVVVIVVRTALEDRMLQNDLAGYRDYASRVRYRLIPGLW